MDIIEKVERIVGGTLAHEIAIEKNSHVIIGLSGGADSSCLFDVLLALAFDYEFEITAVHVNHKIRGAEADADAEFVVKLCEKQNIPCEVFTYNCEELARETRLSTEEMGRKLRYGSFYKVAEKIRKEKNPSEIYIATAHNLNDQAETVLMRIIRGTGVEGLSGMHYVRSVENNKIIRPLLDVKREDIELYCEERGIDYVTDSTNFEEIYTRNKIRLKVLPILKEFNVNVIDALVRLAQIAREDRNYFASEMDEVFSEAAFMNDSILFSREKLKNLHSAVRRRVLKRAFEELGLTQGITAMHMQAMEQIIFSGRTSASTNLPKGFSMVNSYGEIRIFKSDEYSLGHYSDEELKKNLKITIAGDSKKFNKLKGIARNGSKRFALFSLSKLFDAIGKNQGISKEQIKSDELMNFLQVRTRRSGDYICPLGMKGSKKLQDLFTDEKVYREERDKVPLVCIGSEVLWIIGDDVSGRITGMRRGRINENYKLDSDSEEVVILEYL
ncbi:MAG: tRNA lysidine(34) synthetase TilS, partial [Eubacteriales bacterium]